MENLNNYGWESYRSKSNPETAHGDLKLTGRVISRKGNKFEVITNEGIITAEPSGRMLYAYDKDDQPVVGDWVVFQNYGDSGIITDLLPRFNMFYRKSAGKEISRQVMAANLEQVVVIQGLDADFNINRLERYLVQIATCKINPVIILNKSDLINDKEYYRNQIARLQRDVPVFFCSVESGDGIDEVREKVFKKSFTSLVIGSSGVGKSSLLNLLKGKMTQTTSTLSQSTGKGRHTTTGRKMFLLPNGSLIIDTPGMREFGIGSEEDGDFEEQFPAIAEYAPECRYRDCRHINESGCNVILAVEEGEIDPVIYNNYLKLIKEQKHFRTKVHEKKKQGKQFGKMVREVKAYRKKYKY